MRSYVDACIEYVHAGLAAVFAKATDPGYAADAALLAALTLALLIALTHCVRIGKRVASTCAEIGVLVSSIWWQLASLLVLSIAVYALSLETFDRHARWWGWAAARAAARAAVPAAVSAPDFSRPEFTEAPEEGYRVQMLYDVATEWFRKAVRSMSNSVRA